MSIRYRFVQVHVRNFYPEHMRTSIPPVFFVSFHNFLRDRWNGRDPMMLCLIPPCDKNLPVPLPKFLFVLIHENYIFRIQVQNDIHSTGKFITLTWTTSMLSIKIARRFFFKDVQDERVWQENGSRKVLLFLECRWTLVIYVYVASGQYQKSFEQQLDMRMRNRDTRFRRSTKCTLFCSRSWFVFSSIEPPTTTCSRWLRRL